MYPIAARTLDRRHPEMAPEYSNSFTLSRFSNVSQHETTARPCRKSTSGVSAPAFAPDTGFFLLNRKEYLAV